MSLLAAEGIHSFYGDVQALWDVSFEVDAGEIVTLIGANGAGKSTLLKTVAGLLAPRRGRVVLDGRDVAGEPAYRLVERGLVLIPEARQLWPTMTVRENLEMGAYSRAARPERAKSLERVLAMFPVLEKRARQNAGTLSGGEQQMCAIGRGLMARPRILLLDEPALGLAPKLVREVFAALKEIRAAGVTLLLVEQNVPHALALADRAYVLESGRVTRTGPCTELSRDPRVREEFLGIASI
ncbi:MAG: ABC transporter ATP-binding protein [Acidobacteria bacterium]|nr:ABC transporter ATP-binding protein [Acidobacteriota bacterium]MCA1611725.1 ABC transporter ATP-binding protein [Acidobacteriota bacterium]